MKLMGVTDVTAGKTASGFQYSGTEIEKLGASEYTLVQIMTDWSGSVHNHKSDLISAMKTINEACQKHPRSENILSRACLFSSWFQSGIEELHGFISLDSINVNEYDKLEDPNGGTPLRDVTLNGAESVYEYGKKLYNNRYTINSVVFVITDGEDTTSRTVKYDETNKISDMFKKLQNGEILESSVHILIGINDQGCKYILEDFAKEAGFDVFKSFGEINSGSLAKFANFVSQSISTVSVGLTGGNSKQLANQIQSLGI